MSESGFVGEYEFVEARPERPTWDDTFMEIARIFSRRSPDPTTHHGAVVVSEDRRRVSLGYNGYPRNCDHAKMPKERPGKYKVTLHAEANAIDQADFNLKNATLYVTGMPCTGCWARIIQSGIQRVVYGNIPSHMLNDEEKYYTDLILEDQNILIEKYGETHA